MIDPRWAMHSICPLLFAAIVSTSAAAAEWRTIDSGGFAAPHSFGFSAAGNVAAPNAVEKKLFATPAFGGPAFGGSSFSGGSLFSTNSSARYADKIDDKFLFGIETSSGYAAASPFGSSFRGQGFTSGYRL